MYTALNLIRVSNASKAHKIRSGRANQCEGDPEHYVSIWLAGQRVKSTGCQGIITADAKEQLSRLCQKLRAFPVNDMTDQSGSRQKDISIPKSTA
jgi:hypothetical protein